MVRKKWKKKEAELPDENREYTTKVLRVDLSTRRIWSEEISALDLRRYIGGYALGAKYLYDEVPARVGWSHPENRLMFLGGVLAGTLIPGCGGITVVTRGAMTEGAAATQAQGDFAAYLRRSGFIGVIVQGASDKWTYLFVDENGNAQLRDAEPMLGKDTWETEDAVVADSGRRERDLAIFSIGQAGENRVRLAAIVGNKGHVAAHNGVGAVMGSKKLKAVAVVRGKGTVPVADPPKLKEIAEQLMVPVKAIKDGIHYYGTLAGVHRLYEAGNLPVKNYTTTIWDIDKEQYATFAATYIYEHFDPKRERPCWACPNTHCQMMTIPEGPYKGMKIEEPDYEQVSAFCANLGINDVSSAAMLGHVVDRLGMDTNEAGWLCGLVMECFEKGILTTQDTDGLDVRWGNAEATRELLRRIAYRQGLGDVLAEGVRLATQKIGRGTERMGIYTLKGVMPRGHDHRARWHEMFDNCVSESGALENSMLSRIDLTQFGLPAKIHPYDPDMTAKAEGIMKGAMQLEDSAVTCRFNTNMNIGMISRAIAAVTGWDFKFDEGMQVGRRAVHTMRAANIRYGLTADQDKPSPRYSSTPTDGVAQGQSIVPHFDNMLKTYYEHMGWDKQGKPLPETLRAFGLENAIVELWGSGA